MPACLPEGAAYPPRPGAHCSTSFEHHHRVNNPPYTVRDRKHRKRTVVPQPRWLYGSRNAAPMQPTTHALQASRLVTVVTSVTPKTVRHAASRLGRNSLAVPQSGRDNNHPQCTMSGVHVGWRPQPASSQPVGKQLGMHPPAVALTTTLCGAAVLWRVTAHRRISPWPVVGTLSALTTCMRLCSNAATRRHLTRSGCGDVFATRAARHAALAADEAPGIAHKKRMIIYDCTPGKGHAPPSCSAQQRRLPPSPYCPSASVPP